MLQIIFESIPGQKTVTEGIKTWYFPHSAFWVAERWGPLATLLLTAGTFFVHGAVLSYKEMHPFSKSKNKLPQSANREHCYITSS